MLTHLDQNDRPTMVDVTEKNDTIRMAEAQAQVQLPEAFRAYFSGSELTLKKGPVFQTAIIAGTMAAKRTHEVIPFCHHIPVESCKLEIKMNENLLVDISCRVKTTYKTGVEMEALHGASVAALTIYDMCKAISSEIVIKETRLLKKTGGKKTLLDRPVYGLILTGGKSERMGEPKALIDYKGKPHAKYLFDILNQLCDQVFLSARPGQWSSTVLENYPMILDQEENSGPMGALLSAFESHPEANWLVVACDLVHFNRKTAEMLLASFNEKKIATCFANKEGGFPEPLCALYTPEARSIFLDAYLSGVKCPVKVLKQLDLQLLQQGQGVNLANVNTPEERKHEIH
jgi:cyclic pyranopterin monophosphate synthase